MSVISPLSPRLVRPNSTFPGPRNPCPWCRCETGDLVGLLDHVAAIHHTDLGRDPHAA